MYNILRFIISELQLSEEVRSVEIRLWNVNPVPAHIMWMSCQICAFVEIGFDRLWKSVTVESDKVKWDAYSSPPCPYNTIFRTLQWIS